MKGLKLFYTGCLSICLTLGITLSPITIAANKNIVNSLAFPLAANSQLATDMSNSCLIYKDREGKNRVYGDPERWSSYPLQVCAKDNLLLNAENKIAPAKIKDYNLSPCKVIKVHDGDTLRCILPQRNNKEIKIRFLGIDAPELGQDYGLEAGKALEQLVGDKTIYLYVWQRDKYDRYLATVYYQQPDTDYFINVNQYLIATGNAWLYQEAKKSDKFYNLYSKSQREASGSDRGYGIGLWQVKNPKNPKDYRDEKKQEGLTSNEPNQNSQNSNAKRNDSSVAHHQHNNSQGFHPDNATSSISSAISFVLSLLAIIFGAYKVFRGKKFRKQNYSPKYNRTNRSRGRS